MKYYIVVIFSILIIYILQMALIPSMPLFFKYLDLIIISLVLSIILHRSQFTFYLALAFGLLLDIYSYNFFGLHIFSLVVAVIVTYLIATKFFTNRALYSFIFLTIIFNLIFVLTCSIIIFIINFIFTNSTHQLIFTNVFWLALMYQILVNVVAVAIIFYVLTYFSQKLQPFIVRRA